MKNPPRAPFSRGILLAFALALPASAARLAYEGFDYTEADETALTGLNGGTGWTEAYPSVTGSGGTYRLAPGLSFTGYSPTIGKSAERTGSATLTTNGRNWAPSIVSGTYWYSFLMNPTATATNVGRGTFGVVQGASTNQNGFGIRYDFTGTVGPTATLTFNANTPAQAPGANKTFAAGWGQTYLVIGKLTVDTAANTTNAIWVYQNGETVPATEGALPTAMSSTSGVTTGAIPALYGRAFGDSASTFFDEVRISTTYEELFPLPPGIPSFNLSPIAAVENQTLTFDWENLPAGSNPTLNGNAVSIDGSGAGSTTLPAPATNTTYTLAWTGAGSPLTQSFTAIAPFLTISPSSGYLGDTLTLNWRVPAGATSITLTPNDASIDLDSATNPDTGIGTAQIAAPTAPTLYTITWSGPGNGATGVSATFTLLPSFLSVTPDVVADGTTLGISWRISPEWDDNALAEDNEVFLRYGSPADFTNSSYTELTVGSNTNSTTGVGSTNTEVATLGNTEFRLVYKIGGVETFVSDTISVFDPYFNNLVYTPTATNPAVTEKLGFTSGVNAYLDRTHQWVNVPAALEGGHYLQLRQGDRNSEFLGVSFDADPGSTVFVLVDNRVGDGIGGTNPVPGSDNPPVASALPWLASNGFLDSGLDVGSDENAPTSPGINETYSVFFKQVPVDAEVPATSFTLGTMDGVGASPPGRGVYGVVIVKPQVVPVSFHAYVGTLNYTAPVPITSSTLYWTLPTDATGVSIDSGVGSQSIDSNGQGNVIVSPTATTTYTLTASSASLGPISLQTTVTVIGAPPSGFGTYITGNFGGNTVPSGQQGPNDDPDGDGIDNLVEYAIAGGDPTRSTASPAVISGTLVTFNKNTSATGITYALEKSSTLGNDWVPATPTTNDANVITYTLAPPTPSKDFVRLKVTQP